MIRSRVSSRGGPWCQRFGGRIARAVTKHPLARDLDGTLLVGCGDPALVCPADDLPHVIVPLLGGASGALALEQVSLADAAVFMVADEVPSALTDRRGRPLIVIASTDASAGSLLRDIPPYDAAEALDALASSPEIQQAVHTARGQALTTPIDPERIANAAIEAFIALRGSR